MLRLRLHRVQRLHLVHLVAERGQPFDVQRRVIQQIAMNEPIDRQCGLFRAQRQHTDGAHIIDVGHQEHRRDEAGERHARLPLLFAKSFEPRQGSLAVAGPGHGAGSQHRVGPFRIGLRTRIGVVEIPRTVERDESVRRQTPGNSTGPVTQTPGVSASCTRGGMLTIPRKCFPSHRRKSTG